jgi:hypothetical protein
MADKYPEMRDRKITEVLAKLDADVTQYAPPAVRQTLQAAPAEGLLGATATTAGSIKAALEEIDAKSVALHKNAEMGIDKMQQWMNEFANQHAQLLQEMNDLQGRINESVERIVDIGKRPINGG